MNKTFLIILISIINFISARNQMMVFPFSINLPKIMKSDLDYGYVDSRHSGNQTSIDIDLHKTQSWKLYLDVNTNFLYPNELGKSISDVSWKLSSQSDRKYSKLYSDKILIASGKGSKAINLDFRFNISWTDIPSNYSLDINYLIEYEQKKEIKKKQSNKQEPNLTK